MTNSAANSYGNLWDFDSYQPQPTQDTDLLEQLGFFPGLKELLMLRQVHALEHATVWVLSEMNSRASSLEDPADNESLGGLSTDRGFYLYGKINQADLQRAVERALWRLKNGQWHLAVHPRCGTNISVGLVVVGGLMLATSVLLPREPISQLFGLGVATATAFTVTPDLGVYAQKYLTTAIPFNLEIEGIYPAKDIWGRQAYFVELTWQDG
jgi:hypothetical protein